MSTPLADGELAALLRRAIVDEDREAFDRLFDSQAGRLEVLLQSRLPRAARGRIDVADVLQETYARSYRRFRRIPDVTPEVFRRWIVHIALRELKRIYETHLGTSRRSAERERRVESHSRFAARSDGTPSHLAGRRESAAILVEVLEDMPPDYREVILLRDFEGFTAEMIAARMNRSVAAVDVLYHRALLGLSDRLRVRGLSASRY
jgi:RNA polymerase sigma-70 factor (ECF subfamily)